LEYREGLLDVDIHFSEWWNGEGYDLSISSKDGMIEDSVAEEIDLSMHIDELHALVRLALNLNIVSLDELQEDVKKS
jgi:hypothetical protein